MNGWLQDFRAGWRSLARTPGFTMVVVLVMGLGIGVNTMIFCISNTFLFRSLPYIDANRNVHIYDTDVKRGWDELEVSWPELDNLRARSQSFSAIAAYYESQAYMTLGSEPERFDATAITSGLLRVYDTKPILGREFLREEEEKSRSYTVIMMSERIWRERFHSDPQVIGRTVKMNGRVRTIVGVAPPDFRFPETADFFIPVPHDPADDKWDSHFLHAVGKIKPGVSTKTANAEIVSIAADNAKHHPENKGIGGRIVTFRENIAHDMGPILTLLMSAVGFVLLIACANVANLMLAKGAGRQREIALRFALGATRARIVRQLLTESLIVAMFGGALGLLLALWGRDLCLGSIPNELPFWMKFSIDPNTVLFMIGVSLLSAVLAGLMPALQTSQVDVQEALKEGGHHGTGGRARSRMRSVLVVAEIALAVVLLAGAGLMIRSFMNMVGQRSAIDPRNVLTARFTMPVAVYKDNDAKGAFMDGLLPAVAALPGVRSSSAITVLPLSNNSWNTSVRLDGEPMHSDTPPRRMSFCEARPGYFKTIGLAMRAGRDISPQDRPGTPKVAVVSENAARQMWPGKDPLGQRFRFGEPDSVPPFSVVGVVADVRQSVENKEPPAQIYVAHAQELSQTISLVVKHEGDVAGMTTALRRLVQSRDPDMPLYDVRTMEESLNLGLWEQRIYAALMGVFAGLALVIAAVGIYGVMAYSVAQRTQEIGIRMALGAARHDVLRLVVGQAFRLTIFGLGLGLAGAYAVTRLMASLLFGVSSSDPPTFVVVTIILAGSALVAAWVPAERATRVDPMVALRSE